ncbi:MAG: hypothetical protein NTX82_05010 [Candidatus Parcubacteria bacterium]|nr:hypothetical protein [Candidatus Parcubacteria bacterium]
MAKITALTVRVREGDFKVVERKDVIKDMHSDSFQVRIKLARKVELKKSKYCEKCLGKMKNMGTHEEQAERGPVAGFDVTVFKCQKCGNTHKIENSFD